MRNAWVGAHFVYRFINVAVQVEGGGEEINASLNLGNEKDLGLSSCIQKGGAAKLGGGECCECFRRR